MTDNTAATAHRRIAHVSRWILLSGLIAGMLDIVYAIVVWGFDGVTAQQVLQAVASGLLGEASFSGGGKTAMLGLGLHMLIALAMAMAYFIAACRWSVLLRRPWLCGLLYGLLLYAVMNFMVVPWSAATVGGAKDMPSFVRALLPHILLVGWPIAWLARHALSGDRLAAS